MNTQAIYLPPSENFSFASNGSIGSTLATGFSQSGNTLSQYGLNQAFNANAIYGPLTAAQKLQLAQTELGLNSTTPFLGQVGTNNPIVDPFTNGGNIPGYKNYPQAPRPYVGNNLGGPSAGAPPTVNVHFVLPAMVDANTTMQILEPVMDHVTQRVSSAVYRSSTGFSAGIRRAAFPP